jgi:uncharacterized protein (TIRG00374 family)
MEKNKFWLIIVFAVLVYLLMSIYANFGDLIRALESFNWNFIILLIALTMIGYFIRFIRWNFFLKEVNVRLGLKDNLFVFFSGLAMTITPAKAGEIWKGWLIKDIHPEYSLNSTIPVVISDRLTDLLALVFLSMLGILYYRQGAYVILAIVLIFAAFILAIRSPTISEKLISILEKRAGKYSGDARSMHITFQKLLTPKNLIITTLLGIAAWFMECLALFFTVYAFGQHLSLILSIFTFSFASLAGAMSMIPGGLGVAEATLSGLLQYFGLSSAIAIGTAIIIRFVTLWYGTILGMCVYFFGKSRVKKLDSK